jgi:hypothetical protein
MKIFKNFTLLIQKYFSQSEFGFWVCIHKLFLLVFPNLALQSNKEAIRLVMKISVRDHCQSIDHLKKWSYAEF